MAAVSALGHLNRQVSLRIFRFVVHIGEIAKFDQNCLVYVWRLQNSEACAAMVVRSALTMVEPGKDVRTVSAKRDARFQGSRGARSIRIECNMTRFRRRRSTPAMISRHYFPFPRAWPLRGPMRLPKACKRKLL